MTDLSTAISTPERFCPGCGYDLRGIDSERCPECGLATDHAVSATSVIPWVHRRRIGRWRAYFRTMMMAIRRPAALAADVARPVLLRDALVFRRVTTALVAVPCMLALLLVTFLYDLVPIFILLDQPGEFAAELIVFPFVLAAIWFFFLTLAGVQSYWFHPSSIPIVQQNRAIALSYYATAPLALTPIALALFGALPLVDLWVGPDRTFWFALPALGLLARLFTLGVVLAALRGSVVMLRRTTHCGSARMLACIIGLPIAWVLLGLIFLVAIPGSCLFVALLVLSHT